MRLRRSRRGNQNPSGSGIEDEDTPSGILHALDFDIRRLANRQAGNFAFHFILGLSLHANDRDGPGRRNDGYIRKDRGAFALRAFIVFKRVGLVDDGLSTDD